MTSAARPGWYPDPAGGPELYRWWDGERWGDEVSAVDQATRPDQAATGQDPETTATSSRRSTATRVIALVLVVALLVSAGVGVSLVVWNSPRTAPRPDQLTPTTDSASDTVPTGRLDRVDRRATIGAATMVLPPAPYAVHGDPVRVKGVFDVVFWASTDAERGEDHTRAGQSIVALMSVDEQLATSQVESTANAALEQFARRSSDGRPTTLTVTKSVPRSVDGHSGRWLEATIRHQGAKGADAQDVHTHAVRLPDDTVVVALSAVPDQAGAETRRLARESLGSLTVG